MFPLDPGGPTVPVAVLYAALAALGGLARYLADYLKTGIFRLTHLLAHVVVSAFSGLMFAHFSQTLGVQGDSAFLFAGLGGFLGTQAVEFMTRRIMQGTEDKNNDAPD